MSRISTYNQDSALTGADKVLGTDASGSITRNYSLESIIEFFNDAGLLSIFDGVLYEFKDYDSSSLHPNGIINVSQGSANNTEFSAITILYISNRDKTEQPLNSYLDALEDKHVRLTEVDNLNNFGIYSVTTVEDTTDNKYKKLTLQLRNSNGTFTKDKAYFVSNYSATYDVNLGNRSVTDLSDVTDAGSGEIITDTERTNFQEIYDNGLRHSDVVDNLTSTSDDTPLSANQGKVLKGLIDAINTLLTSDNTDLDTLQEVVDFIEANKDSLDNLSISNIAGLQAALDGKQATETGKGLSTEDFTSALKTKLEGIEPGGEVNVQPNWNETNTESDAFIQNKPTDITDLTSHNVTELTDVFGAGSGYIITDSERTKLQGIETGAEVNVNADWNAASGDAQILNKPSDITNLSTHFSTELADISNAGSGQIITASERTKLEGIETSADVTDTTNVVAALTAGANVTIANDGTISSTDTNTQLSDADIAAFGYIKTDTNTQLSNEEVQDIVGGMVTNNSQSGINVTYQDADGTLDFSVASQTDQNFTTALKNKLDGIEASADVTDTTNVVGALTAGTNITIAADGTISSTNTNTQLSTEQVQDIAGPLVASGGTKDGITVTYNDNNGNIDFVVASQTDENFTTALKTKLDGIETSADVTDTTNVVSALTAGSNITIAADGTISAAAEAAERIQAEVKNTSGALITEGTPVYITGNVGNSDRLEIAPADASDPAKMPAVGVLEVDLANNGEGYVIKGGHLKGIATATIDGTSMSSNDTIYVKPGGGLTATKPTGSNLIQNIAKVARVHASNGSIIVSSILRTNDVPNLSTGKIWVGSSSNTIESTAVYIDETNGRLGIGETNPASELHITDSAASAFLRLESSSTGFAGIAFGDADLANECRIIYDNSDDSLRFNVNNDSERMRINSNGNVNVGNSSTGVQFEVHSTDEFRINGVDLTSSAWNSLFLRAGASGGLFIEKDTNNVGIGTTSPSVELEVDGHIMSDTHFRSSDTNATLSAQDGGNVYLRPNGFSNTSGQVVVVSSGNVGIGTDNPQTKIQVDSTSNFSMALSKRANTTSAIKFTLSDPTVTASTWKLEHDGGENLNLFGYSADDLIISTNSTERMRINSDGNVGIGETNPLSKLHVKSDSFNQLLLERTGSAGLGAQLKMVNSDGEITEINNTGEGDIQFKAGETERMRIDSDGNVGIGKTNPDTDLHIESSSPTITLEDSGATATATISASDYGTLIYHADPTGAEILSDHIFRNDGSETMRIDSSGNVQIGSGTRYGKFDVLDVGGSGWNFIIGAGNSVGNNYYTSGTSGIQVFRAGSTDRMRIDSSGRVLIGVTDGAGTTKLTVGDSVNPRLEITPITDALQIEVLNDARSLAKPLKIYAEETIFHSRNHPAAYAEAMRINSSGNVGINETSPSAPLEISRNMGGYFSTAFEDAQLKLSAASTYNSSGVVGISMATSTVDNYGVSMNAWRYGTDGNPKFIIKMHSGSAGGVEAFTIDTYGNVGIGTTSPSATFDIERATGAVELQLQSRDSSDTYISFGDNNDADVGQIKYAHSDDSMRFNTNASERMRINSDGSVELKGGPLRVFENNNTDYAVILTRDADEGYVDVYGDGVIKTRLRGKGNSYFNAGNVGIGTTSPDYKLDVAGGTGTGFRSYSNGFAAVDIESTRTSGNIGGIRWETTGDSYKTAEILAITNGGLDFKVGTGSAPIESKMFINSSGDVGIGTIAPSAKLYINGGTSADTAKVIVGGNDAIIKLGDNQAGGPHGLQFDGEGANDGMSMYYRTSPQHIVFEDSDGVGGSGIMVIKRGGNVGIGTTNPGAKLEIYDANPVIEQNYFSSVADASEYVAGGLDSSFRTRDANVNLGGYVRILNVNTSPSYPTAIRGGAITFGTINGVTGFANNPAVERMRIDPNGKVGIGTDTPAQPLHINRSGDTTTTSIRIDGGSKGFTLGKTQQNADYAHLRPVNDGSLPVFRVMANSTAADAYIEVWPYDYQADSTNWARGIFKCGTNGNVTLQSDANGNVSAGDLYLGVASANTAITVRNSSGGNVGIGTTSPGHKLEVNGVAQVAGALRITETGTAQKIVMGNQDSGGVNNPSIISAANGNLYFGGGNSWDGEGGTNDISMTILDNGNVGIGTTSPSYPLEVNGGTVNNVARFVSSDANAQVLIADGNSTESVGIGAEGNYLKLFAGGANRFQIDSDGNVDVKTGNLNVSNGKLGIGISTTPDYQLVVSGSDAATLQIKAGTNTSLSRLFFGDQATLASGYLNYDHNTDNLIVGVNNAERMRIDSSGKVLIQVPDDSTNDLEVLTIKRRWTTATTSDRATGIQFSDDNSQQARILADRTNSAGDYKSDLVFITNTGTSGTDISEKMRIDSDGVVTVNGHTHTAQGVQTITTTSGTINLDASTYGVFRLTSDLTGSTTLNLQNMKGGQVIDITVSGSQTITLTSDDTSETFNKVGEVDYDGASDNHIQVVCIDSTDSAAIYNYAIATYTSDTTP